MIRPLCRQRCRWPMAERASFAADPVATHGRSHTEPPSRHRDAYQRDRDRIVHSNAFRRLVYKTQVFVNHEGDLYRTRLTHSLEVAQVARSVANVLRLNEELSEAICLAHDLGHTPFGHAGQDALNACMRDHGGFEHNLQSLRVVDELELKYPEFRGLNLSFETREGILKHCSLKHARELGSVGRRFIDRTQPGAEAQLANIADAIAYNHHDIDDGIRAGLLSIDRLLEHPLFAREWQRVQTDYPDLDNQRRVYAVIRGMIGVVIDDLIGESQRRLKKLAPQSIDDIRAAPEPVIAFSEPMLAEHQTLKRLLREELYRHPRVVKMTSKAQDRLKALFEAYQANVKLIPAEFRATATNVSNERMIADYIAGMTDRFAIAEHDRILSPLSR